MTEKKEPLIEIVRFPEDGEGTLDLYILSVRRPGKSKLAAIVKHTRKESIKSGLLCSRTNEPFVSAARFPHLTLAHSVEHLLVAKLSGVNCGATTGLASEQCQGKGRRRYLTYISSGSPVPFKDTLIEVVKSLNDF